jgi:hypothetical protein
MRYLTFGASETSSREADLTALVLPGFVYPRQPLINQARDAELAGDDKAATRFSPLHRLSVLLNALQWFGVLAALVLVLS